jgi:glucosamine--fructose-6-phosphate aminotransferase (isomerizing)
MEMSLTHKEIFSQYDALNKTYEYMLNNAERIRGFRDRINFKSITLTGAGSGFCLCQSAELSLKIHLDIPAQSFAAGDLMINYLQYEKLLEDTLLVTASRSGSTSEVLNAVKSVKENNRIPIISICTKEGSELSGLADLNLDIPWAFDESVCQTSTVTNLYTAYLMLAGILGNHQALLEEIGQAIERGESFMQSHVELLKQVAQETEWENVVVLGDSELQGIAGEAALAFMEIAQVPSNYYHVLDVRHGPMVMIDHNTLVVMACLPIEEGYQQDLIADIQARGAKVVSIGHQIEQGWRSNVHIEVQKYTQYGVMGIPFIFVPQCLSYFKALVKKLDPDSPQGLLPWIKI